MITRLRMPFIGNQRHFGGILGCPQMPRNDLLSLAKHGTVVSEGSINQINKHYMDWTNSLATELETGEREVGTEEELERLEAEADDKANRAYDEANNN